MDTIHRVWLGGAPIPDAFEEFWARMAVVNRNWTLRTWTEDDLDWLPNPELLEGAHNFSEASDVARFAILARHGGVYVDVDVEPIRPFDRVARNAAFAGWEFSHRLGTATLGCQPGHPAFVALVDRMPAWVEAHDGETSEKRTGPVFLTSTWWKRRDVARLPRNTFYPVGWFEREKLGGPYPRETVSVHHWNASWVQAVDA